MAYTEEPVSEVEKYVGRRMPITVCVILALCYAIHLQDTGMTSALIVLLTAIITTYFKDVGTETQNKQVLRQEAMNMEGKNGE
jgi:hypothetical protein